MKELNRKIFITIFTLLSFFSFSVFFAINFNSYHREYEGIKRTLSFNDMNINDRMPESMMIFDYNVYTIRIKNNSIGSITSHGFESTNLDLGNITNRIIKDNKSIKIGNLYFSDYAYKYENNIITLVDNTKISSRLNSILLVSLIILAILEIIIYYVSSEITKWIVKPAEEALQKQKDFIADASHELKTPLAVIMASSDELKSDKKNTKYINNIKNESERMNKLITSMLDLSKIENVSKDDFREENLSKIVEKMSLTVESIAYEEQIKILTDIEDNIKFNCDKEEMERLISIILDNAIKHSYKDSIINVNMKKEKNAINIEIINDGDPIKKEDEEKIFERFYRVDKSRNRKENRYGLGLAIAKSIVNKHNGIIKAHSENNKTKFTIIFKI